MVRYLFYTIRDLTYQSPLVSWVPLHMFSLSFHRAIPLDYSTLTST